MTKKQKKTLLRILSSGVLLASLMILGWTGVLPEAWYFRLPLFLTPYGIVGWDVLWKAIRGIRHGQVFDETFLMSIATIGAFCIEEYPEAVFVMLFYQLGELLQNIAVGKSRDSIASLASMRAEEAHVFRGGELVTVSPEEVSVEEVILVRPGERIPLDGVVRDGESELDLSSLTGESMPQAVSAGNCVYSGAINCGGVLEIIVTKPYEESTVAKILELVESSALSKSKAEGAVTKFAKWYTPTVVIAALLLFAIPSIITGDVLRWLRTALVFLVVSCPCALLISIPLAYFGGLGSVSRQGILVKGANHLEALSELDTAVFDKTGTLTEGKFRVFAIRPVDGVEEDQLMELAASAEKQSNHPVARAILEALGDKPVPDADSLEELPGRGISAACEGKRLLVGNRRLMEENQIAVVQPEEFGTLLYIAFDGVFYGSIVITDAVKESAVFALSELRREGVRKIVMLTGDRLETADRVAKIVGVDDYHAELLPLDKVRHVEALLSEKRGTLLFAGDGVNDAPVLALADVGVAMGAIGSDAAIEAADVVLMDDDPQKISAAVRIARFTKRIVRQNIAFALAVKFVVLLLGVIGFSNLFVATFADVGVAVIAVLNAMRTLAYKAKK
ncbi:MAG: cadmium-translocating P-type ATPase [Clostridia bacterium]|nr:cadmium-translocating P-type ATPase [Clostridia bacterium]